MTDKLLIKRELLERLALQRKADGRLEMNMASAFEAGKELRALLDAPRQPEGDAISRERVQAEADAFFDWPTTDKSSVTTTSCLIFARCIAGMVAAERDSTIAELREECERLTECIEVRNQEITDAGDSLSALRQQLAERDAAIEEWSGTAVQNGMECDRLAAQRDRLAGLLRRSTLHVKASAGASHMMDGFRPRRNKLDELSDEIDAALAEVNK